MRLRRVFAVQTAVFLLRMGLDQLYTGRAGGSARGKSFNDIISTASTVCPM